MKKKTVHTDFFFFQKTFGMGSYVICVLPAPLFLSLFSLRSSLSWAESKWFAWNFLKRSTCKATPHFSHAKEVCPSHFLHLMYFLPVLWGQWFRLSNLAASHIAEADSGQPAFERRGDLGLPLFMTCMDG